MTNLPLDGIRIADFSQVVAGPYATLFMAQMGAEVIKIETASREPMEQRTAGAFSNLNGSKKSITLNLKDPRGVTLAKNLVKVSHIVVENFATGVMERFGLGYDELRKVKPDIIMLSNQALGRSGPLKDAPGYGPQMIAFAGLSSLSGYKGGRPGRIGSTWGDHLGGMLLTFATMAALYHAQRTGIGQYVQISMAENLLAAIPEAILDFSVNGRDLGQEENREVALAPHNVYRCKGFDNWVAIAVTSQEKWIAFCQATGKPEWVSDPRFADSLNRWDNQEDLDKLVTEWTLQHTDYEAMYILQEAGVAAGPVLDAKGLFEDPHLNERGYYVPLGEVQGQPYVQMAHPWRMSDSPPFHYTIAPTLGEHNEYVFGQLLGLSSEEIIQLTEDKVLS